MNEDFYLAPPSHAERWRGVELSEKDIADATKKCVAMFNQVSASYAAGFYTNVCIYGEPVFFYDFPYSLTAGHIYSEAGMTEFKISQCCEYHFDEAFGDDDG